MGLSNGTLLTQIGTNTSFVDYNVMNGVTYTYKVSAVNSIGESVFSNEVSATPMKEKVAPPIPGYEWIIIGAVLIAILIFYRRKR